MQYYFLVVEYPQNVLWIFHHQQREKSEQIAKTMASVDKQRQHAEQLLYSMIPKPTAIRLKNGEDPINMWEVISPVLIVQYSISI